MLDNTTRRTMPMLPMPTSIVGCIVLSAALMGCVGGPKPVSSQPAEEPAPKPTATILFEAEEASPCALESPIVIPNGSIVASETEVLICGKYEFTWNDYAAIIGKDADHENVKAFAALFYDQSSAEEQAGIAACVAHVADEEMLLPMFGLLIRNYVCAEK